MSLSLFSYSQATQAQTTQSINRQGFSSSLTFDALSAHGWRDIPGRAPSADVGMIDISSKRFTFMIDAMTPRIGTRFFEE
jgi:hypothetical protein